MTLSLGTKLYF